ncbi:MAG: hypothetical protein A3B37_01050 [Candidatus Sungbacteria bacterium RIFCSPLOWO2_01_FULL_59_16]|uniref:Cation-transporting P-type ATPase N-terminal domain-containing protein n=1 Tax=Candidatus Sungbacteria bacterium RIFCSPLOWO2_01_FULL_59_16 TaxID=1802280 RepID=A0A1G2LBV2_9BACT|nr:MAG: hypothetical protein A3B37_01050 [Candidatus Sungbacteria bacterium RIFCSPLOWO2_01_FULL_59_16]
MNRAEALSEKSIQQPFWAMSAKEALAALASRDTGLSEGEARKRRKTFGENTLSFHRRLGRLAIVLNQFKSPLILVLVLAGIITMILRQWTEAAVIFSAVLANSALGFWQENKAETVLDLLASYVRTRARVRRGDGECEIDAALLVPGDVIRIRQGDRVPADARIIFANGLEVDEAVLTGESSPVAKSSSPVAASALLAERASIVFGGTLAVGGFADTLVTATGGRTEFGKIAALAGASRREATPLQSAMARFAAAVGLVLGVLVATLFALGLWVGYDVFEMFLIAVAVAVSAVPEGLPVALTVILAVGVERLARRKGVVRKLLAAETLGSASVILTDKTGTLTTAQMELAEVLPHGSSQENLGALWRDALLNTDVAVENPGDPPGSWRLFGRPLETALVRGAVGRGVNVVDMLRHTDIPARLPFSAEYKAAACLFRRDGRVGLAVLGAPEVLSAISRMSDEKRAAMLAEAEKRAAAGERVLAVAGHSAESAAKGEAMLATLGEAWKNAKTPPQEFEFHGLLMFRDPLRPGAGAAIRRMEAAGVKTIIVSGDHRATSEAVARELGMADGRGAVLTGEDLVHLSGEELSARAGEVRVYARVTPEQKLALVKLYRERGEVVAVTGDGVNDAPALAAADIGVAVGSGTDVAKSAADLVLLDDNFETLVAAVEEGRRILDNIRKVIIYLLSSSLDELFLIGGALLTGVALPLNALQIIFVNFFSDSFPAVALAFEDGIDGPGSRPRRLGRNIFDRTMRFLILVIGVLTSALLFALYYWLLRRGFGPELVRSFIFASFATYSLLLAFSVRSLEKSIFSYNPLSNPYLVVGTGIGFLLTALVIYVPLLQAIFNTVALPPLWLASVIGVGLANVAAVEFGKWLVRSRAAAGQEP